MKTNNQEYKESDIYTKMMFGENAIRVRGLIVAQQMNGHNIISGTCGNIMQSDKTHELIECEIIIRPIKRTSTNDYIGHGITRADQEMINDYLS